MRKGNQTYQIQKLVDIHKAWFLQNDLRVWICLTLTSTSGKAVICCENWIYNLHTQNIWMYQEKFWMKKNDKRQFFPITPCDVLYSFDSNWKNRSGTWVSTLALNGQTSSGINVLSNCSLKTFISFCKWYKMTPIIFNTRKQYSKAKGTRNIHLMIASSFPQSLKQKIL